MKINCHHSLSNCWLDQWPKPTSARRYLAKLNKFFRYQDVVMLPWWKWSGWRQSWPLVYYFMALRYIGVNLKPNDLVSIFGTHKVATMVLGLTAVVTLTCKEKQARTTYFSGISAMILMGLIFSLLYIHKLPEAILASVLNIMSLHQRHYFL